MQTTRSNQLQEVVDPMTVFSQDARHRIAVYRKMIGFKEDLLIRIRNLLAGLPAAARHDEMDSDLGLLEDQLQRYRRRLEFWYARQWQLEGLQIDDEARTVTYRDTSVSLTRRAYQHLNLPCTRSPNFRSPNQLLVQAWHDARLPEQNLPTHN